MRRSAFLLIALSALVFGGCGPGVTVEGDSPVDIPKQVEAGGVTVQAPDEVNAGGVRIENEDGRVTAR